MLVEGAKAGSGRSFSAGPSFRPDTMPRRRKPFPLHLIDACHQFPGEFRLASLCCQSGRQAIRFFAKHVVGQSADESEGNIHFADRRQIRCKRQGDVVAKTSICRVQRRVGNVCAGFLNVRIQQQFFYD